MTDTDKQLKHTADLRRLAEAMIREKALPTEDFATLSPEEIHKTFHEFRVHQIELEMQNEELRRAQDQLESLKERYWDLYDLAPVGYVTISEDGLIGEANLTAAILLGLPRSKLLKQPLSRFICKEDQDIYFHGRKNALGLCEPRRIELRMVHQDGTLFWARMMIASPPQTNGSVECRVILCDITERHQAEEALLESEKRYRLVFESASDALFLIDIDTTELLKANHRAAEIYGYGPEELLGMKVTDLSAEPMETLRCIHEARQTPDTVINIPLRLHRRKDGTVFPVEMTARIVPLKNRPTFFVAARDITERRQMEEALRQSEQRRNQAQADANARLREQTDSLASIYYALDSIGLIICDLEERDCRIAIFNSGAEKLFGYRREEAVGRSIALIYPPEFLRIIPGRVKKLRQGKSMQSFDMTLVRKSGERFPAVISIHPFDAHEGGFRKVVGVFRDISELMATQEQLKAVNAELESRVEQRTRELQESQRQVQHTEKLSAIGQLSASIAHEFNNPLQGILSVLKGLKKRAILENEDRALLEAAINEGDRIKDLIRSLQEFNRPSTGRQTVVDVHKSLDSILLLHKSDFNGKRIAVVRNYAEELPRILAVPDQIKQVFLNLLTNAADACQKSGGEITVSTWEEGDRVAVAIKDTGVGIEPQAMERIFQPFYTTKAAVKGTGLGLSVCHGIVKQHQGEIRVESRPGEGTTFTVLLPVAGVCNPVSATEG